MHAVFRIEKNFSAIALSYGFPHLDMEGMWMKRYLLPIFGLACLSDVSLLPHLLLFPPAADLRQQIILLHNPQHSFRVAVNILTVQPQPHPPITVGAETALALLRNTFCKLLWPALNRGKIPASSFRSFRRSRFSSAFTAYLPLNPKAFCHFPPGSSTFLAFP